MDGAVIRSLRKVQAVIRLDRLLTECAPGFNLYDVTVGCQSDDSTVESNVVVWAEA